MSVMSRPHIQAAAIGALAFTVAMLSTSPSVAQDEQAGGGSLFDSKHVLSFGGTRQSMDASISATVADFDPVGIKLEDLGIDNKDTSYYAEYRYRFKPRWSLLAGAYTFAGTGGRISERDFNYDGVEYTAGSELTAELDADAYLLDIMYTAWSGNNYEIMVGGGIHALDLGATIGGSVRINEFESEFRQSGTSLLAPVPNLRFAGEWEVAERLTLSFISGWLSANVDDYSGDFLYNHIRATYSVTEKLGVSLGYQRTDADVTESRENGETNFDIRLDGPTVTLVYAF